MNVCIFMSSIGSFNNDSQYPFLDSLYVQKLDKLYVFAVQWFEIMVCPCLRLDDFAMAQNGIRLARLLNAPCTDPKARISPTFHMNDELNRLESCLNILEALRGVPNTSRLVEEFTKMKKFIEPLSPMDLLPGGSEISLKRPLSPEEPTVSKKLKFTPAELNDDQKRRQCLFEIVALGFPVSTKIWYRKGKSLKEVEIVGYNHEKLMIEIETDAEKKEVNQENLFYLPKQEEWVFIRQNEPRRFVYSRQQVAFSDLIQKKLVISFYNSPSDQDWLSYITLISLIPDRDGLLAKMRPTGKPSEYEF